jgi:hypothetical protein
MLKCNINAAVFKDQNCYGAGMCGRNDKGNYIQVQTLEAWESLTPHEVKPRLGDSRKLLFG